MAKFGGFGGGMNMQAMMKQAQKMQQDMLKAQEELAELEVTGSAGGELVQITMTCDNNVTAVSIKLEAVDPDDVEMLEDLIVAAFNDAQSKAQQERDKRMGAFGSLGGLI